MLYIIYWSKCIKYFESVPDIQKLVTTALIFVRVIIFYRSSLYGYFLHGYFWFCVSYSQLCHCHLESVRKLSVYLCLWWQNKSVINIYFVRQMSLSHCWEWHIMNLWVSFLLKVTGENTFSDIYCGKKNFEVIRKLCVN